VGTRTDHTVAERAASAHRHGYDREMFRVQKYREADRAVCVKPYRRESTPIQFGRTERVLERIHCATRRFQLLRVHILFE
jgi:hypothetical protein